TPGKILCANPPARAQSPQMRHDFLAHLSSFAHGLHQCPVRFLLTPGRPQVHGPIKPHCASFGRAQSFHYIGVSESRTQWRNTDGLFGRKTSKMKRRAHADCGSWASSPRWPRSCSSTRISNPRNCGILWSASEYRKPLVEGHGWGQVSECTDSAKGDLTLVVALAGQYFDD